MSACWVDQRRSQRCRMRPGDRAALHWVSPRAATRAGCHDGTGPTCSPAGVARYAASRIGGTCRIHGKSSCVEPAITRPPVDVAYSPVREVSGIVRLFHDVCLRAQLPDFPAHMTNVPQIPQGVYAMQKCSATWSNPQSAWNIRGHLTGDYRRPIPPGVMSGLRRVQFVAPHRLQVIDRTAVNARARIAARALRGRQPRHMSSNTVTRSHIGGSALA